jgi:hypothetical protein
MKERRKEHRNNDTARTTCYQEIRICMKDGIAKYYKKYPERLLDERSKEAIDRSMDGLQCIFQVLDKYQIGREKP